MADVISVTNSDSAFDASKGVTRTNLPPFAQRLRKAADLVWEEAVHPRTGRRHSAAREVRVLSAAGFPLS